MEEQAGGLLSWNRSKGENEVDLGKLGGKLKVPCEAFRSIFEKGGKVIQSEEEGCGCHGNGYGSLKVSGEGMKWSPQKFQETE